MERLRGDAPVDVCLQRLEADSGQIDVLNSKPEEARTAVYDLHKEIFPMLLKQQGSSKSCCNTVNTGNRHIWDEQRGW